MFRITLNWKRPFQLNRILLSLLASITLIVSIPGLFQPTPLYAGEEFSTSYDITYNVDQKGITTARQVILLKNKLDHVYATEYTIIIGSTTLTNIKAADNFGDINPQVTVGENETRINLNFTQHIIGKDKTRSVTLLYETPDFATVKGQVLEVGFPLLANYPDLEEYTVTLNIPEKFGKPTQIIPQQYATKTLTGFTSYIFKKEDLSSQSGVTATFGTEQIYNFSIRYRLENKNPVKGRTEIALVSDTNYQDVLYQSLEPLPTNVIEDSDGNWLATYIVEANSQLTVEAKGTVKVGYFPKVSYKKQLTPEQIADYTKPDLYWESNDAEVVELAKELGTPKAIYDYLVTTFDYNYDRISQNTERFGAQKALLRPDETICMEFTDTFIALARAAGIPAREHNGYAYTENEKLRPISVNQDILHAWPEYYDTEREQWIQIDPTWGNTTGGLNFFDKFDLDHISFVIHGHESTYPVTAGSYKIEGVQTKDVEVSFGSEFAPRRMYEVTADFMPSGVTGLPISGKYEIINTGNARITQLPLSVLLKKGETTLWGKDEVVLSLPPYGKIFDTVKYTVAWNDKGGQYSFEVKADTSQKQVPFEVKPLVRFEILAVGGAFLTLLLAGTATFRFLRKKKQLYNPPPGQQAEGANPQEAEYEAGQDFTSDQKPLP